MTSDNWTHTWDGIPIAQDEPHGAAVHVRRPLRSGGVELLLLHRAHHGADYDGDWAWTSPTGARHPGEPVYQAAERELAEEAGIVGATLWPHDLSGRWASFVTDVAVDIAVNLVDPEHDRWTWVTPERARAMVLPAVVGAQFATVSDRRAGGATFSPLEESDLSDVVRWQHSPHAREWFAGGPVDVEAARLRYGPRIKGDSPTRMWRVDIEGRAAGYLQAYRVVDYDDYAFKTGDPEAIGFDYVIGEADLIGQGWGPPMIWSFVRDVLMTEYPAAPRFLASPDHRNHRSLRVLELCGFRQGLWIDVPAADGRPGSTEVVCTLDRHHWFGAADASSRTSR
jgi:8-oxo-dGTP pyrophosphatase MutT (NUDIX family)